MKNGVVASCMALACMSASACREVCSPDELRHGDKCELRPDARVREQDASGVDEDAEAGTSIEAGPDTSFDARTPPDDAAPDGEFDACAEETCDTECTGANCKPDPCTPNPCANGGTCSATGKLCTCPTGFSGPTCEVDACDPNPCLHGGICSRTPGETTCDCTDTGFGGTNCEADINECAAINVCTGRVGAINFSYSCRNEQPFYSCIGQFPDWPLADPADRYSAYSGIVLDSKTGLTWQQDGQGDRSWYEANNYCDGLSLGGFSDWRLPSRAELESIIDFGRPEQLLDPAFKLAGEFWSSSPFVGSSNMRWAVDFGLGSSHAFGPVTDTVNNDRVRCVRGSR